MKNATALSMALGGILLLSAAALAATEAGSIASVVDVVKEAYRTPPEGSEQPAKVGDALMPDETIRTASDSAIEITFPDGASLRLEADSDLVLDTYVFDPTALKSAAAISVTSGIVRYATGEVSTDDSGVAFTTPVGTVGIRGTDIVISVGADGATVVDVLAGKITAKPLEHEEIAEAEEGQSIFMGRPDQPPQVGNIGDFGTAAGPAASTSSPGATDDESRDKPEKQSSPAGANDAGGDGPSDPGGGNSGGGNSGGGDPGGGDPGGGNTDGDGDGNAGHGDNPGRNDGDNPGKGGGNGGGNGNGNGGGGRD